MSEPSERQQKNMEVTGLAFAAFLAGDEETQRRMTAPDAEIFTPNTLANSGTYRGFDGYMEWQRNWLDAWEDYEMELLSMEPAGERHVVTLCHQSGRGRGSGVPVEMSLAFMTELEGEKLLALHLYPTAEEAHRVAAEREAGPQI